MAWRPISEPCRGPKPYLDAIMIEIFLVACLIEDPSRCKDVSLVYSAEGVSLMQCLMMSPAEIAKWSEVHPRWFTKRWTCRPAGRYAKT